MPAITDAMAKRASAVQEGYNRAVAAVQSNSDLSQDGRLRQLSKLYTTATETLGELRAEFAEERAITQKRITREVFGGHSVSGADAISMRDAAERVNQIDDPDEAAKLLDFAEVQGDEVLARAIAQRAHRERGGLLGHMWQPVLSTYLGERPSDAAKLEALDGASTGAVGADFNAEGYFFLVKPSELERIPPGMVREYAGQPEPAVTSVFAEMSQQLGRVV